MTAAPAEAAAGTALRPPRRRIRNGSRRCGGRTTPRPGASSGHRRRPGVRPRPRGRRRDSSSRRGRTCPERVDEPRPGENVLRPAVPGPATLEGARGPDRPPTGCSHRRTKTHGPGRLDRAGPGSSRASRWRPAKWLPAGVAAARCGRRRTPACPPRGFFENPHVAVAARYTCKAGAGRRGDSPGPGLRGMVRRYSCLPGGRRL